MLEKIFQVEKIVKCEKIGVRENFSSWKVSGVPFVSSETRLLREHSKQFLMPNSIVRHFL